MADVDTIVVLDGIQFQKETTSDIYTIDGDGANYEAVKTYPFTILSPVSGARVLFNGEYDADGARHHVRVRVTKLTSMANGTPTKTQNTQALEWTTIDPNGSPRFLETAEIDLSAAIQSCLHIDVAISDAQATTGLEVIVQVRHEVTVDEWSTVQRFIGPTGTPTKSDFAAQEAVGQTILSVTNPTAGNLNHIGKFIFLEDTATIGQCEIAWITECGADA